MQEITFKYKVGEPICNPNRVSQAFILCRNSNGKLVLANKKYYPEGICRLLGGGMDDNEDPRLAAARELHEELAIPVSAAKLQEIALVKLDQDTNQGNIVLNTYIYFYDLPEDLVLNPSDDVSGVSEFTLEEFQALIDKMKHLTGTMTSVVKGKDVTFQWSEWGIAYADVHQVALDWYKLGPKPQPDFITEIITMCDKDQEILKREWTTTGKEKTDAAAEWEASRSKNINRVMQIVNEHGFIGLKKYGETAYMTAWVLVQHGTEEDVELMEKYLGLMKANPEECRPQQIAYLTDKILVRKGLKQRYGSQMHVDEAGVRSALPLEDPDNVDSLRAAMGLGTLAEYLAPRN